MLKTLGIEVYDNNSEEEGQSTTATDEGFMKDFLSKLDGIDPKDVDWGVDKDE
jgi:hypothetical protein